MMMEEIFLEAALEAGDAIMKIYNRISDIRYKSDASPVTEADHKAEDIILKRLAKAFPDIPVVAEESVAAGNTPEIFGSMFFLVDPLDGTKEFVNRGSDFTVNIALIENGLPIAGIVYAPASAVVYRTNVKHMAEKLIIRNADVVDAAPIHCRSRRDPPVAVVSRSHSNAETEAFLEKIAASDCVAIGSSLKFCLVAEGLADVYPRLGRTMEWDTAAGDAVLRAAGGMTFDLDQTPLRYGKTGQSNDCDFSNPAFVSWTMRS